MSHDGWAALPRGATGLSAVCDSGISWSYSLTIFSSPKLDFYKCVYKIQTRAPFADLFNYRSDRSTLTQLRLSAHKLKIEKGRYFNIPRKNRICTVCSTTSVENEIQFLLECSAYSKERRTFSWNISNWVIDLSIKQWMFPSISYFQ